MRLSDSLHLLVGGRTAKALEGAFGLTTVGGLLRHYPRRYARRGELTDLGALAEGEQVTVSARVLRATNRPMRGRQGSILEVEVGDGCGTLTLTFFNQAWRMRELRPGRTGLFAGKVGRFRGERQLTHPDYVLFADADEQVRTGVAAEFLRDFLPVYPASANVRSWTIAECVRMALDQLELEPDDDPVPVAVAQRLGLLPLGDALRGIHLPDSAADIEAATKRLKFDEAWAVQVALAQRRSQVAGLAAVPRPPVRGAYHALLDRLPFSLTAGQEEVLRQLEQDLAQPRPMQRLLQGEVGSGKTVVALLAMLRVVDNGGQAALLAPTSVLAEQHLRSLRALLGPLAMPGMLGGDPDAVALELLTGASSASQRRAVLSVLAAGTPCILVGTHALLQEAVRFADLGLVVIDEQHRFGVEQRSALVAKAGSGRRPHTLVMTATPIPRTVAMTVFGDLAVSTLRELPAGRAPIATHVVPTEKPGFVARMWQRIAEEVAAGHRAYIVCPRIDSDEESVAEDAGELLADGADGDERADGRSAGHSVLELAELLADGPLSGCRLGVLHGRLPADEKDSVMRRFADGEVDVLVATTVVEVGVDVPEATVMVVMDADRFGVSQLHQLRGRVGRGGRPGLCLLHTASRPDSPGRARCDAVAATTDGFALAEADLALRREGDVLGAVQSGRRSSLRLLSVLADADVIDAARREADRLVEGDPRLGGHPGVARLVAEWTADRRLAFAEKA